MKISIIGDDGFIKKNLTENLNTICDGRNRTRTSLHLSAVSEGGDGDVCIVLPDACESYGKRFPDINAKKIILICTQADGDDSAAIRDLAPENPDTETVIYHAPLICGKWDETDDIIATFCKCVAEDRELPSYDSGTVVELLFIEDLIEEVLDAIEGKAKGHNGVFPVTHKVTLDTVAEQLQSFNKLNSTLLIQEIPERSFSYKLYSMYLSFLPERKMSYPVDMHIDNRGVFSELIRTPNCGQVSINIAKPGVTRGQHWHNTKWEIFIVVSGHGLIREREIGSDKVISFEVRGEDMRAVIMLPGYTHSITNLEPDKDLVTVMYANEHFDPSHPDTFFENV